MRIAVFVCNYSLGASVALINTCYAFAERGIRVDVFSCNNVLEDQVDFRSENIFLWILTEREKTVSGDEMPMGSAAKRLLKKCMPAAMEQFIVQRVIDHRMRRGGISAILPDRVLERSRAILDAHAYTAFVGVEPHGLIWADILGREKSVPHIYLSLELYIEGDVRFSSGYYGELRKHARAAHQRAIATIIQDRERAEILAKQDSIPLSRFVFVPVSMKGDPVAEKSTFLYNLLNIPRDKKILIYLGLLNEGRLSLETAQVSVDLPEDWVMVLHGWCPTKSYQDEIGALQSGKLYLSTNMLPFERLVDMIASAHVGVSLYASFGENEKLTGVASSKTAQYLQCGLPIIVNDFESIRKIVDAYRHGICVASPARIPEALDQVIADYDGMRQRAFRCYKEKYEITPHFEKVIDVLRNISDSNTVP